MSERIDDMIKKTLSYKDACIRIIELPISVRSKNALRARKPDGSHMKTLGDVVRCSEKDLKSIRMMGDACISEIRSFLESDYGVTFESRVQDNPLVPTEEMTLRDYFAAKAMQGLLAGNPDYQKFSDSATDAYDYADRMLAAR